MKIENLGHILRGMDSNESGYQQLGSETEIKAEYSRKKIKLLGVDAAELVTCDKTASSVLCDTYIYDPDETEAALGSLYLVLETVNSSEKAQEVIEAVATAIRKEYFRDPSRGMYDSLEEALKQANHVLSDYVEQGEADWVENFHAAACAFFGQNLHISRVGTAELLLARKGRLTDIGEGLSDNNLRRPHHAFTSVASGSVAENDIILLATPQLAHLIPNERLNHMATNKTPSEIVGLLRSLLDDSRENTAFALLLLQFSKLPERLPPPEVPLNLPKKVNLAPQSAPPSLIRSRRPIPAKRTLWNNFLRIVQQLFTLLWKFCVITLFPAITATWKWSMKKGRTLVFATANTAKSAIAARRAKQTPDNATLLGEDLNSTENANFGQEENLNDEDPSDEAAVRFSAETEPVAANKMFSFNRFILPFFNRARKLISPLFSFKNTPRTTKVLLVIVFVFIVLFAFGIRSLSQKRKEDITLRGVAEQLEQARVKKDNADSALIYNNQAKARQDLQEALALTDQVNKSGYYKDESAKLIAEIQAIGDRIEKVTRVNSPSIVGDFASIAGSLRTPAMVAIEKNIFTFDPVTNAIYSLNLDTKETKIVSQSSQGIGYFRAATPLFAENSIVFTTDTPGLAIFDTQRSELLKQDIKFPDGVTEVQATSVFGSRLYLLSLEKKMIYGFSKTLAGYDGGGNWLTDDKVPADRATGMGIDGYIYLLLDDGRIIKMLKGKPVEFKQEAVTTPVVKPSRLLIYDGIKHLYVLDQAQKRVLVYDTVGNLVNQYVFPDAKDLRDIAINGKEDTLFVLDQTQVYSVQLKAPITSPTPKSTN